MKGRLDAWWRLRTARERRLLVVMGGLLLAVSLWLLLLRPLGDALAAAHERHDLAVVALGRARAEAEALARLEGSPAAGVSGPLDVFLSQSATEAGFQVAGVQGEGPALATLSIDAARPQAFFGWVRDVEARGLVVERLSVSANSDRTLSIRATFRARSG